MTPFDIDAALLAYLGGAPGTAGIQPATMEKRLAEFAGDRLDEMQPVLDRYLERTAKLRFRHWPDSLSEVADYVERRLATEMPELSGAAHRKLASYYTYANR